MGAHEGRLASVNRHPCTGAGRHLPRWGAMTGNQSEETAVCTGCCSSKLAQSGASYCSNSVPVRWGLPSLERRFAAACLGGEGVKPTRSEGSASELLGLMSAASEAQLRLRAKGLALTTAAQLNQELPSAGGAAPPRRVRRVVARPAFRCAAKRRRMVNKRVVRQRLHRAFRRSA